MAQNALEEDRVDPFSSKGKAKVAERNLVGEVRGGRGRGHTPVRMDLRLPAEGLGRFHVTQQSSEEVIWHCLDCNDFIQDEAAMV